MLTAGPWQTPAASNTSLAQHSMLRSTTSQHSPDLESSNMQQVPSARATPEQLAGTLQKVPCNRYNLHEHHPRTQILNLDPDTQLYYCIHLPTLTAQMPVKHYNDWLDISSYVTLSFACKVPHNSAVYVDASQIGIGHKMQTTLPSCLRNAAWNCM